MFLKKLFGTSSTRYIKKISPEIQKINDFYDGLSSKSDEDLADRTNELKKNMRRSTGPTSAAAVLPPARTLLKLCIHTYKNDEISMPYLQNHNKTTFQEY